MKTRTIILLSALISGIFGPMVGGSLVALTIMLTSDGHTSLVAIVVYMGVMTAVSIRFLGLWAAVLGGLLAFHFVQDRNRLLVRGRGAKTGLLLGALSPLYLLAYAFVLSLTSNNQMLKNIFATSWKSHVGFEAIGLLTGLLNGWLLQYVLARKLLKPD